MSDDIAGEDATDQDFTAESFLTGPLRSKVLAEVGRRVALDDDADGYFRDFRDGTGMNQLDGMVLREAALRVKRAGNQVTWKLMNDRSAALVGVSESPDLLRQALIAQTSLAIAWIEAIDRRKDERKFEMRKRSWWTRARAWWRRRWT